MSVTNYGEQLKDFSDQLEPLYKESLQLDIEAQIDYATTGLQALFDAVDTARRYTQRMASILARSYRLRGGAGILISQARDGYQSDFDVVVVRKAMSLTERLSWEEKASFYRTALIDETIEIRSLERQYEYVKATVEAIEARSRAVFAARIDLMAQFHILERGDNLHEL